MGIDDDLSVGGGTAAGQFQQAGFDLRRQAGRTGGIEAQLHGGRHLVDILSAGTGRTDIIQFALRYRLSDSDRFP